MIDRVRIPKLAACLVAATVVASIAGGTVNAAPKQKPDFVAEDPECAITELRMDIDFDKQLLLVYTGSSGPPVNLWGKSLDFVFTSSNLVNVRVTAVNGIGTDGYVIDPTLKSIPFSWNGSEGTALLRNDPTTSGSFEIHLDTTAKPHGKGTKSKPMPKLVLKPTKTCPK